MTCGSKVISQKFGSRKKGRDDLFPFPCSWNVICLIALSFFDSAIMNLTALKQILIKSELSVTVHFTNGSSLFG